MKRRDFLKFLTIIIISRGNLPQSSAETVYSGEIRCRDNVDDHILDYLYKMRHFDQHHKEDFNLEDGQFKALNSTVCRFKRLQQTVGHSNFCLISFDKTLKTAKNYVRIGRFTKQELNFLESIFYSDSSRYGFFGQKPLCSITDRIKTKEVIKISESGHYLYKGKPFEIYQKIKKDVGKDVILTSGIRSITKQFLLFLNKAVESNGNLSLASRSLAPPGYSYHGIGDFDIGQAGFGIANFSERFTETSVFKKLKALGYLKLRYPRDNFKGVRSEPWHIKVNSIVL